MYKINPKENKIESLQKRSFGDAGFKERENLQEWIAKEPTVFGEELLIIQKEFSGFDGTRERLDLLALDKQGSLVIIENKLDDTGRGVTWQALRYASYCSTLSKENIRKIYQDYLDKKNSKIKAEEKLSEFFSETEYEDLNLNKGVTQRIILIAGKFRTEVTSTVLWLLNFNIQLKCFRATLYSMGDEFFLNIEQIIPIQDAEEYMIGVTEKAQYDMDSQTEQKNKDIIRKEFWAQLIQRMNQKSSLYQNISPGMSSWISAGSGVRGIGFNFSATRSYVRAELYIDRSDGEENKSAFNELFTHKTQIEKDFGGQLVWDLMEGRRACRIKTETPGNVFDEEQWDTMQEFMVDSMLKLEHALMNPLKKVSQKLGEMRNGD